MKKRRVLSKLLVSMLLVLSLAGTFAYAAVPTIRFVEVPDYIFENPIAISVTVADNISNPQLYVDNVSKGIMQGSNGSYYLTWTPPNTLSGAQYTIEVKACGSNGSIAAVKKTVRVSGYKKEELGIASSSPYHIEGKGIKGQDCLGYVVGSSTAQKAPGYKTIEDYNAFFKPYGYTRTLERSQASIIVYGYYNQRQNSWDIRHFAKKYTGPDAGAYDTIAKLGTEGEVVRLYSTSPYNSMWGNEIAYYRK